MAEIGLSGLAGSRVCAAIELSASKWLVALRSPGEDKTSLFQLPGGDLPGLLSLLERHRAAVARRGIADVAVCTCYEAGYDGFWLHRALEANGISNVVLDSASIRVNRRRKHVKTDRTDARGMLMVLMALYRGEDHVCSTVRVPSEEEEDRKRVIRSRESLLRERVRRVNRIRGLLHFQGVRHVNPNRADWQNDFKGLKTRDGRVFPSQLLREIRREATLLATVRRLLAEIDVEVRAMSQLKTKGAGSRRCNPVAARLTAIRGIGPQFAAVLATEVFYRSFNNRREVASYVGLTPTPYASGSVNRDQGISKAGNRRARRDAIELAWLWLRHQPESVLSEWYRHRVADGQGRVRRIAITALARKITVALWRYVEQGLVPEGAMIKA